MTSTKTGPQTMEPRPAADDLLDVMRSLCDARQPFALATVVETLGSVSAKTGAKAVMGQDGRVVAGWVGGGCAEATVCHAALDCLASGESKILDLDLDDEVLGTGMPCGGSMRVYVEPVLPNPRLWLLGHGQVAESLCVMGARTGFEVIVSDPLAEPARYPAASRLVTDDLSYDQLTPEPDDYVVVATQHKGDHQSMERCLRSRVRYIALIASRMPIQARSRPFLRVRACRASVARQRYPRNRRHGRFRRRTRPSCLSLSEIVSVDFSSFACGGRSAAVRR